MSLNKIKDDFISSDNRSFRWRLGNILASSLTSFIAGFIVAAIIFFTVFDFALKQ